MTPMLGKLEKVELRSIWTSESRDFTPWLAQLENIAILGETIGLDLEVVGEEQSVGPYSADIVCTDTATGDTVLIENQLEKTDHTHLGQIITYASGLDASCVIWIAARFTEEHRSALDWLNEQTPQGISFFGLEVELWRIGDSPVAPKFNLVSEPNSWSKSVRTAVRERASTETMQLKLDFWSQFREYVSERSTPIKCQAASPQAWMNHSLGRSDIHLVSVFSSTNSVTGTYESGELRVELWFKGTNAKTNWDAIHADQQEIDPLFEDDLYWHNLAENKSAKIYVRRSATLEDREQWPEFCEWLISRLERMYNVFHDRVMPLPRG